MALIPIFAWLFLAGEDLPAFYVLAALAGSDWIDGFVARRMGQVSSLGKLLDPVADRAAIMTVLLVLVFRGTISAAVGGAILVRDVIVSLAFLVLEARGFPRLPVNATGKLATSVIFLGVSIAVASATFEDLAQPVLTGTANWLLVFGAFVYWAAGALYLRDVRRVRKREHTENSDLASG